MHIAIIGAGMAGCACGLRLLDAGHDVSVFDKGRGPGGRMSTRRMEAGDDSVQFDHGAQYFTVRDPGFAAVVASWRQQGIAAPWPAAGEDAWVGTPAMNAPIRQMAALLDVNFNTRIERLSRSGDHWFLHGNGVPTNGFYAVVIAIPAEQVAALLAGHAAGFAATAQAVASDPCWTVMLAFEQPLAVQHDTVENSSSPIAWAARNSAKPDRGETECWVVQASPEWSRKHLEEDAETVLARLRDAFADAVGSGLPATIAQGAHRWRYARPASSGDQYLWDPDKKLGLCGDWLVAPRVEAAWMSGRALAHTICA